MRYLGVLDDSKLNWNEHCKYVSAKASRSLNFLHYHLYNSSISIKSIANKCIVWPVLEYACPVWHLYSNTNVNLLESIQCRAVHWASNSRWNLLSYCCSKSSDDCMQELHWPTIKQRHKYFSICHVHDSLHHRSSLPFHNHFQLPKTTTRSHPPLYLLLIHIASLFCKQPFSLEHHTIFQPTD